ncbi:MAG: YHS domain-containing protein [Methanobacteriota archaeon]|nr:MAG: YHS domain-containing protein [Euryarchaeota archaeon]
MAKDPVCGMSVDERTAKFTTAYGGKTWYFCSSACKTTFEKNPVRYAR